MTSGRVSPSLTTHTAQSAPPPSFRLPFGWAVDTVDAAAGAPALDAGAPGMLAGCSVSFSPHPVSAAPADRAAAAAAAVAAMAPIPVPLLLLVICFCSFLLCGRCA